jgi:type II secretory pathway pseudopilin PulG
MRTGKTIRVHRRDGEDGYMLIAVMFMLFLLALSLTVAAPRVAREIQLDREREAMHRGLQYRRAIQLYYRKFHAYPPNLDALVKSNDIRFLRKKYIDPTTGKDEWKPIRFGQAKTPTLGFFGQPLAGAGSSSGSSVLAGVGPSGSSSSSSLFSSSSSATTSSTASTSSSSSSSSGQTFGGVGIIGFSPMSARQSIMIYKKKNHYNEWEFVYDPLSDQKAISSSNLGSLSSSATTANALSSSSSSSNSSSSSSTTSSSSPF